MSSGDDKKIQKINCKKYLSYAISKKILKENRKDNVKRILHDWL